MHTLACDFFSELDGAVIPLTAIVLGCLTGMVAIVGGIVSGVMKTRAREQTKRELAAYVAEGTIDPDKAVALLNAGGPQPDPGDFDERTG